MVSWDMEVKFLGHSPHIKELVKIAKQEGFSNIEDIEFKGFAGDSAIYRLIVNNRGTEQKEFKAERVE